MNFSDSSFEFCNVFKKYGPSIVVMNKELHVSCKSTVT